MTVQTAKLKRVTKKYNITKKHGTEKRTQCKHLIVGLKDIRWQIDDCVSTLSAIYKEKSILSMEEQQVTMDAAAEFMSIWKRFQSKKITQI
jgi:hypothetical protein